MAKPTVSKNPGMTLVVTYGVLLAVNAVILYLANMFFPKQVVLGTHSLSLVWAILLSMGTLALIDTFAIPFAHMIENRRGRMLSSKEWMVKYFFLNFFGLWVISHFSQQFGLGITIWYVSAVLAVLLDVVQGVAMMTLQKKME